MIFLHVTVKIQRGKMKEWTRIFEEHLLPAILEEKERKVVLERTDNLFKRAFNITKLSPVDIIKALDFRSKDISLGRIDAFFAELRTIIFLSTVQ